MLRAWVLLWLLLFFSVSGPAQAATPQVTAVAAVLLEGATGQILWARNPDKSLPPASTTKIVTASLALTQGGLQEIVTASPRAAAVGEASIFLRGGEELPLEDMLKGALIRSGNDAALALAEHTAGSQEMFAWLMNRRARLLGAGHSHFVNPHGLPDPGHRTTAYDLAVITRFALEDPRFAAIVRSKETTIPWPGYTWKRYLRNTNRLLWNYPGAIGVKTGTTREAGPCLVAAAEREGRRLIAVVLNSRDRYGDAARLLDYGFQGFQLVAYPPNSWRTTVTVRGGVQGEVGVTNDESLLASVPPEKVPVVEETVELPRQATAPVHAGQPLGRIKLELEGRELDASTLVAVTEVEVPGMVEKLKFRWRGRESPHQGE